MTLSAFMHLVQTFTRLTWPLTTAVTFWMFGRNTRLVTLCEWLTFRPAAGLLAHRAQTFDIMDSSRLEPSKKASAEFNLKREVR